MRFILCLILIYITSVLHAGLCYRRVLIVSEQEIKNRIAIVKANDYTIENYTVQEGDTLKSISLKYYGLSDLWQLIYEQNKETINDPDLILPGQTLRIKVGKDE